ncbi:hypothetical protein BGY98DRAFT_1090604 [Russula aff. rugulosa BPL654]|nr:hypothetical protein BGY98DRAFT_1090604 [Russula aff. rugulosa BPL654]
MDPYLQFMCGPLLRYDSIDRMASADAGSTYEPYPTLKYRWDPRRSVRHNRQYGVQSSRGVDLGPHPADPLAAHYETLVEDDHLEGPNIMEQILYVYFGTVSTYTFWRFSIQIQLTEHEMKIQYSVNDGLELDFFVPNHRRRCCNGFSASVNPDDFRGPGFQTGYDPVWIDLVVREPEMQGWLKQQKVEDRRCYPLSDEISSAIDHFYFNHYCQSFRSGAFARANSSIPMLNMLDDHGSWKIDGFGNYPDDWQNGPVFKAIGSRGYFFFLLFQCSSTSLVLGNQGPFVPFPSHSFLTPFGPTAWILMLDCRAERKLGRIFDRLDSLPARVEHLIVQLGIPITYPRMVFLENTLSSKFNPLVTLGRSGSFGTLKGAAIGRLNTIRSLFSFDDDFLLIRLCQAERNRLIERLQQYALRRRIRISFLSGNVHCAAVGVFKTLKNSERSSALSPTSDHRYMLNVVTSAFRCSLQPPNGVLTLVNSLSTKRHRTLHYADTDEEMIPLFDKDTDGSKPKSHYIMGRRNWCSISLKQPSCDLLFDIRVEKEKGRGETVGYSILAPPPRWTAKAVW